MAISTPIPTAFPVPTNGHGVRHVLGMTDLAADIDHLIHAALDLRNRAKRGPLPRTLDGKAVVVVFEKNSTRTRVSFDLGIQRLGGASTILDAQTSQLGRGESIEDTAKVLSRYADAIVYRANSHAALTEMAEHATVPVVNALTPVEHPCQVLADLATLVQHARAEGRSGIAGEALAYIGDGNNMCHSYLLGAPLVGMDVRVATPPGYGPDPDIVRRAEALAATAGTSVEVGHYPTEAVAGAHAVATDTWVSMGDEDEATDRLEAFEGYTIDDALMAEAHPDAVFLHCLPGHWGHEATYEVAHGPQSRILDEAENRMWTQMALLERLINGERPVQAALQIDG